MASAVGVKEGYAARTLRPSGEMPHKKRRLRQFSEPTSRSFYEVPGVNFIALRHHCPPTGSVYLRCRVIGLETIDCRGPYINFLTRRWKQQYQFFCGRAA